MGVTRGKIRRSNMNPKWVQLLNTIALELTPDHLLVKFYFPNPLHLIIQHRIH